MSLVDALIVIVVAGLFLWIVQLKRQVRELLRDRELHSSAEPSLSASDIQQLHQTLAELVSNIEYYTESQLQKMNLQHEAIRTLGQRLTDRIEAAQTRLDEQAALEEAPPVAAATGSGPARITVLPPQSGGGKHRDKDRIIELHQRGWTPDRIAKELRLNQSEVQLIVNLV